MAMRNTSLFALCSALLLTSCAEMHVTHVEVATGATNPPAIYIRPFSVAYAKYSAYSGGNGPAIRKSLAPAEFANDLQQELAKLAPAMVIKPDEFPRTGWLVEGEFEVIRGGDASQRCTPACAGGLGKASLKLHVRITDVDRRSVSADQKEGVTVEKGVKTNAGVVIYEFDVAGSTRSSGPFGTIYAPGTGDAIPFNFRNAAERIMLTLSPDPFRYGYRSSPTRNY